MTSRDATKQQKVWRTLSAVSVRIACPPQFWISVRGITSRARDTARYGHCCTPVMCFAFSFSTFTCRNLHITTNIISNISFSFFLLPTKFLQPANLAILTTRSLFNHLAVPAPHLLSPFLANQPSSHWKSQIAHSDMHHPISGINSPIHSVSLASHVSTHLLIHLSAHLCHHHSSSITPSLKAQNLPF